MKIRTTIAAAAIVVIGGLGTVAGVASAQSDPAPTPPTSATAATKDAGAKGEFVCANLDQIQQVQADHATTIKDRLVLLASAKTAAQDAGKTKLVARIDARIAKLTARQEKVTARQQKVADFAAAHCPAG
jgi:flagellar basal body-associated protein FliL